eukprot:TRINITY_DN7046_c0_g1_i2.p1 TRINITY_DN7046_c0_g1~~TRINITY_DN7046_c0_g1_i2.p1  ORF type:complete len:116 (+),score=26.98 TRINITY_DN7046_c0_g1_i2:65-412(+)
MCIRDSHNILLYRVLLWAFISLVSTREYYEYITSDFDGRRIPAQLWIAHLCIFIEYIILFKFTQNEFVKPFPNYVSYTWLVIFIILGVATVFLLIKDARRKLKERKQKQIKEKSS